MCTVEAATPVSSKTSLFVENSLQGYIDDHKVYTGTHMGTEFNGSIYKSTWFTWVYTRAQDLQARIHTMVAVGQ